MKFRSFEVERERDGWDDREEGNYMMGFVMYSYTLSSHVVSECTERRRFRDSVRVADTWCHTLAAAHTRGHDYGMLI